MGTHSDNLLQLEAVHFVPVGGGAGPFGIQHCEGGDWDKFKSVSRRTSEDCLVKRRRTERRRQEGRRYIDGDGGRPAGRGEAGREAECRKGKRAVWSWFAAALREEEKATAEVGNLHQRRLWRGAKKLPSSAYPGPLATHTQDVCVVGHGLQLACSKWCHNGRQNGRRHAIREGGPESRVRGAALPAQSPQNSLELYCL
jgi:hypothetical protein